MLVPSVIPLTIIFPEATVDGLSPATVPDVEVMVKVPPVPPVKGIVAE